MLGGDRNLYFLAMGGVPGVKLYRNLAVARRVAAAFNEMLPPEAPARWTVWRVLAVAEMLEGPECSDPS